MNSSSTNVQLTTLFTSNRNFMNFSLRFLNLRLFCSQCPFCLIFKSMEKVFGKITEVIQCGSCPLAQYIQHPKCPFSTFVLSARKSTCWLLVFLLPGKNLLVVAYYCAYHHYLHFSTAANDCQRNELHLKVLVCTLVL